MTQNESDIMKEAFYFLRDHSEPPPLNSDASDDFWKELGSRLSEMSHKWGQHPLSEIFITIYNYIELKQKAKGGK